jgi:hypothetical protein
MLKIKITVFLFVCQNIFASKFEGHSIDYRYIWQEKSAIDQGEIPNCHVFTLVSALEAQFYKENRQIYHLSDLDLYLIHMYDSKRIFSNPGFLSNPLQRIGNHYRIDNLSSGSIGNNLKIAKKYGLVSHANLSYPQTKSPEYLDLLQKAGTNKKVWDECKSIYHELPRAAKISQFKKARRQIEKIYLDKSYKDYSGYEFKKNSLEERKIVKQLSKNISIQEFHIYNNDTSGSVQKIKEYLSCNPVVVSSVENENLDKAYFGSYHDSDSHSMLIIGYNNKNKKFVVRNSWGNSIEEYNAKTFITHVVSAGFLHKKGSKKKNCSLEEGETVANIFVDS